LTIPITFLIRQLNVGGAQRQLVELVSRMDISRYQVTVITLYDGGRFVAELCRIPSVSYVSLGKKCRWDVIGVLFRLVCELRKSRPRILHGYLGLANILCVLVKPLFPNTRMVWGVRASTMDLTRYDWVSRVLYRIERSLSRFADLIIVNSEAGYLYAAQNGFPEGRMVVVNNGFDTERFLPKPEARSRVRCEWRIGNDETVIGIVGRLDPMKDHPVFFQASAKLLTHIKRVRFICVGEGVESYRNELHALTDELGLDKKLIWAGARDDMVDIYNSLDILVSSSCTEGFSNVIAEAMSCGIPCVVTDVGDSRMIVGDTGFIVCPKQPDELASRLIEMIQLSISKKTELKESARSRIAKYFSVDSMVTATLHEFSKLK
jgi:glycosyltransferase involved in cell wall biosynthesis